MEKNFKEREKMVVMYPQSACAVHQTLNKARIALLVPLSKTSSDHRNHG